MSEKLEVERKSKVELDEQLLVQLESRLVERMKVIGDAIVGLSGEVVRINQNIVNLGSRIDVIAQTTSMTKNSAFDTNIVLNDIGRDVEELTSTVAQVSEKIDMVDNSVQNIKIYKYVKRQ